MWKPGDVIAWRGIFGRRVWHVQPTIVVKDSPQELLLTLLPGTECIAEETYLRGKKDSNRRWEFKDSDWKLEKYTWQTNRLLLIFEPEKFYSIIHFWNNTSHEFLCYYINFQEPFRRNAYGVDTLDLDLDIIIRPDLSFEWKDEDDYQQAIEHGVIFPEWVQGIEAAKKDVFAKLERRQYPFDGRWLNWMPDPNWEPPKLPVNWDKI